ncbi:MAG: hypothetical protein QOE58_1257, partial [Actinomycetota bacterium]|nr:hypothetical protein [Actinomycetota bacterium]
MTNKALLIANWSFEPGADIEEQNRWPALKGPRNDVKLMVHALTEKPYGLFERENIICCENFAKGKLETAIEDFFKDTETDDYVLVYYTGHGFPFNRKLRLVTHDAHKDAATSAMPIATIDECVGALNRAEQYVLILDCCYAGAADSSGEKGNAEVATLDEILPGRWALYSSDQYST